MEIKIKSNNMEFYTAKLDEKSQQIIFNFPFGNFKIHDGLASIPYCSMCYDHWEMPVNKSNIEKLKKLGFSLTEPLLEWDINKFDSVKKIHIPVNKSGLVLYPYQIEGVSFIEQKNGRALIADEMGLGKTVQALSWLQLHPNKRPVLIICPSSLKINWKRETIKWLNYCNPEIVYGKKPYPINGDIIIINYDILFEWLTLLRKFKFEVMIADEAHYIKNFDAKRTVAFNRINKYVKHLIALTGTPIENKPIELLSIISSINPSLFPNYQTFIHRFCGGTYTAFGNKRNTSGATNTFELNSILKKTIMIRRKKMDVLKDLPSKQIVKIPLEISNKSEYQYAEKQFVIYIRQKFSSELNEELEQELKQFAKRNKIEVDDELSYYDIQILKNEKLHKISKAPVLAQIETLKQLAVNGKMKEIISWIETFLESNEKLVVFAIHKKVIKQLIEKFPNAVKVDGSVTQKQRQKAVDTFQNNPDIQLFIGNIRAAGVGLTLTAASNVAIIQFPWSPSVLNQAIDRVHRITQKKQVTAWNLVGENTIEERILDILRKKESIISQVLDGEFYEDKSVMMELIESYKEIKMEN